VAFSLHRRVNLTHGPGKARDHLFAEKPTLSKTKILPTKTPFSPRGISYPTGGSRGNMVRASAGKNFRIFLREPTSLPPWFWPGERRHGFPPSASQRPLRPEPPPKPMGTKLNLPPPQISIPGTIPAGPATQESCPHPKGYLGGQAFKSRRNGTKRSGRHPFPGLVSAAELPLFGRRDLPGGDFSHRASTPAPTVALPSAVNRGLQAKNRR
jgi:hypothetical protein